MGVEVAVTGWIWDRQMLGWRLFLKGCLPGNFEIIRITSFNPIAMDRIFIFRFNR